LIGELGHLFRRRLLTWFFAVGPAARIARSVPLLLLGPTATRGAVRVLLRLVRSAILTSATGSALALGIAALLVRSGRSSLISRVPVGILPILGCAARLPAAGVLLAPGRLLSVPRFGIAL